jgi:hypothetical protein
MGIVMVAALAANATTEFPECGVRRLGRGETVTPQRCTQHIRRSDMAEFSYRYNPETGRWEIIKRRPDGTAEVLHKVSFSTRGDASNHVAILMC